MAKVGFVGLGIMGGPMANHLKTAGHDLLAWNRTVSKSEAWAAKGMNIAQNLEEIADHSDIIFTCVTRTEDVMTCVQHLSRSAKPETTFVDHSTIGVDVPLSLGALLAAKFCTFVDAPITGGSVGAEMGQLTIFCGGEVDDFAKVEPVMAAYAKKVAHVGRLGAGQRMKMANQIAVGGALLALCESFAFAEKAGLDLAQTRELLLSGAAGSWAMDIYGQKILNKDWLPGFSIDNQLKDFGYCQEAATEIGASLPGTTLVQSLLARMQEDGRGSDTTAALFELFQRGDID